MSKTARYQRDDRNDEEFEAGRTQERQPKGPQLALVCPDEKKRVTNYKEYDEKIKELHAQGLNNVAIAKKLGIPRTTVQDAVRQRLVLKSNGKKNHREKDPEVQARLRNEKNAKEARAWERQVEQAVKRQADLEAQILKREAYEQRLKNEKSARALLIQVISLLEARDAIIAAKQCSYSAVAFPTSRDNVPLPNDVPCFASSGNVIVPRHMYLDGLARAADYERNTVFVMENLLTAPAYDLIAIINAVKRLRKAKRQNNGELVKLETQELKAAVDTMLGHIGYVQPDHRAAQPIHYLTSRDIMNASSKMRDLSSASNVVQGLERLEQKLGMDGKTMHWKQAALKKEYEDKLIQAGRVTPDHEQVAVGQDIYDDAKSELRHIFETKGEDTRVLIQNELEQPRRELPEWLSIFSVAKQPSDRYKYTGQHVILLNLLNGPMGDAILALESLPGIVECSGKQCYIVKHNDWVARHPNLEYNDHRPDQLTQDDAQADGNNVRKLIFSDDTNDGNSKCGKGNGKHSNRDKRAYAAAAGQ